VPAVGAGGAPGTPADCAVIKSQAGDALGGTCPLQNTASSPRQRRSAQQLCGTNWLDLQAANRPASSQLCLPKSGLNLQVNGRLCVVS